MINSCLSCSSDIEIGQVTRTQGALGDYFCGRCARDGIVCLTYETGLAKLAELIIHSEGMGHRTTVRTNRKGKWLHASPHGLAMSRLRQRRKGWPASLVTAVTPPSIG